MLCLHTQELEISTVSQETVGKWALSVVAFGWPATAWDIQLGVFAPSVMFPIIVQRKEKKEVGKV